MNYVLTDNATGTEYVLPFAPSDFHRVVGVPAGHEPTLDQARQQIAIWNRSQLVHRQEFSYRLA